MQAFAVPWPAGVDVLRPGAADERAARSCGNVNPTADKPPACKNVRRANGVEAFSKDRTVYRFPEVIEFVRAPSAGDHATLHHHNNLRQTVHKLVKQVNE